jgi:hypothetical protein
MSLLSGKYPATELSSSQPDFQLSTDNWTLTESELLHDWRFTTNQIVLATSPLRPVYFPTEHLRL